MHCDSIKLMLNDFFNKTLSRVEERKVEGHLAECENCRYEFGRLEKADNTLKKVMHEMVAGIEVPNSLNERIETALALEKRPQPRPGRLLLLARTPAVAAALLLVVLAAGFLSYYNLFSPAATQQKVVLSEPQAAPLSVGSGPTDIDNSFTAADENTAYKTESQDLQGDDTNKEIGTEQQSIKQPAGEPEKTATIQPPPPAVAMKSGTFEDTQTPLEKRSVAVSSTPQAAGASAPALSGGTEAGDAGFVPARPTYLPQGMKLEDVSWRSGVVYQNYRIGDSYVTISQGRAPAAGFNYDELAAGGVPVNINGARAVLEESGRDSNDNISGGYAAVRWQLGEWVFSVSGGLPGEEIIKIASSLE
ncbi:MAG: DUF4367 domain-containing protein [Desulfotomaculaceae bacterium]